jgi:hypothetical protein
LQATFDINPSSTRILKAKAKKTSIQLQWKASAGNVTGYQVMYSKKNNFRKAVNKTVKTK